MRNFAYKAWTYFNKIFHEKPCFQQGIIIWHRNWLEHCHTFGEKEKLFHPKTRVLCRFSWKPEYNSTTKPQNKEYHKAFSLSVLRSWKLSDRSINTLHITQNSTISKDGYSLLQSQRMETLGTQGITLSQAATQRCWCWHCKWMEVGQDKHFSSSLSFQILQKLVWTVYMVLGSKAKQNCCSSVNPMNQHQLKRQPKIVTFLVNLLVAKTQPIYFDLFQLF